MGQENQMRMYKGKDHTFVICAIRKALIWKNVFGPF